MQRRALIPISRAIVFFLLYWSFSPAAFWWNEREPHFWESVAFGALAAFIHWRHAWAALRARFANPS